MRRQYFWIKQDELTGWEPALRDMEGRYWPVAEDGWVREGDLLALGPELCPPPPHVGKKTAPSAK